MKIQFIGKQPERATPGSSGFDLCYDPTYSRPQLAGLVGQDNNMIDLLFSGKSFMIIPQNRILVPTGLFVAIPSGYEMQIRPRSGLAIKQGITVLNSPGTIDADYRQEIKVVLINHGLLSVKINVGDRIAQAVFQRLEIPEWQVVEELPESTRDGGFGSTGR